MPNISFFSDGLNFTLKDKRKIKTWLLELVSQEGKLIEEVNVIITTDEKLKAINEEFLKHFYYTDIITFQYDKNIVCGEIYISLERVKENASNLKSNWNEELHRVMAHGFLHMCGYSDKTDKEKLEMRSREDFYLNLRKF